MNRREHYTWQKFDRDCRKVAAWAKKHRFKNIYGIPRGGLAVALRLSHLLELPLELNPKKITARTLVVDDIADRGTTLAELRKRTKARFRTATLFLGPKSKFRPDFWARKKTKWIVFPWETTRTSKYDGTAS